jgi:protein SCO1
MSVPAATTPHEPLPGEAVPDVPLINQDGKTLHLGQFKGKAVLLTFIYTRCPFPTFCPLVSSEFAAIENDLAENPADYDRAHLVSISLDPDYDLARVLRKYGLGDLQDDDSRFAHWDNQISHSMNTILLAPDGTVIET